MISMDISPDPQRSLASEVDALREENLLLRQRQADLKVKIKRQADDIARINRTNKGLMTELRKLRGASNG